MESKKINQLATELTPALDDLTIIGDPTTGISKKITLSQMASLFTGTVEEYANFAAFPLVGVADTIYIALDTNVLYRWNTGTNAYVELSPNIINSLVFSDANGFDGNISLVGSTATLTITTALTTGSVPFIGASGALSQDNANLFFDDTNNRLGIGTNAPTTALDVFGSGIIGRLNGTSTNNAFLGFASAGTNRWSIGNVQADHRFRIYNEATTSELISLLSTGEFGIGIANPTTKFHIDGGASALIANLDANISVAKSVSFRSDNSNRINLEVSGTESGSNAGANFFLRAYSDAGALLSTPLTITRSTGAASFSGSITTIGGRINIEGTNQNSLLFNQNAGGTSTGFLIGRSFGSTDGQDFFIYDVAAAAARLTISSTGISTFSSAVVFSSTTSHTGTAGFGIGSPTAIDGTDGRIITNKFRLYSTTPATIYTDFVTAATTNRSITIPDLSGTIALLEGTQTFSGSKTFSTAATFTSSVTANNFVVSGGNNTQILNSASATTGWVQIGMNNTSGSTILGIESSVAGTTTNGSLAYATILRNYTATDLQLATNNIVRATITSGGNVGIGMSSPSERLVVYKGGSSIYSTVQGDNNASYDIAHAYTNGTNAVYCGMMRGSGGTVGSFNIHTGGAIRMSVTSSGNVVLAQKLITSQTWNQANVGSGGTTSVTLSQPQFEYQSTYIASIVGLYAPSGVNQNGFYTGLVTFFTDGSSAQANVSALHANGWGLSVSSTTGGTFTFTFNNSSGGTMTNIWIRILKINKTFDN